MPNSYQTSRRVEFRDTDAAGIAHFSVFFTWMEEAEHEFLRSLGLSVVAADSEGTITWPRVSAQCDYLTSLKFEEVAEIGVRIARLGTKSAAYKFLFNGPRGIVAQGQLTAVCCRVQADGSSRSMPIPDWIRAKLASSSQSD